MAGKKVELYCGHSSEAERFVANEQVEISKFSVRSNGVYGVVEALLSVKE